MFKICNICFKTDTRGNEMISIQMSTLDRIAHREEIARIFDVPPALVGVCDDLEPNLDHLRGHVHVASGPDLQPTNYCTSMWNGVLCMGDHEPGDEWHSGSRLDNGGYGHMWHDAAAVVNLRTSPMTYEFIYRSDQRRGALYGSEAARTFVRGLMETLVTDDQAVWFGTLLSV